MFAPLYRISENTTHPGGIKKKIPCGSEIPVNRSEVAKNVSRDERVVCNNIRLEDIENELQP